MAWFGRAICILLVAGLAGSANAQSSPSSQLRVALVIANGSYQAVPRLDNPERDGALIADALKNAGFGVVQIKSNLTKSQMDIALRDFKRLADNADIALIYFAGHGIEIEQQNWLLPVDARLEDQADVYAEAVSLDIMLRFVASARQLRVVVLDACRDNPFALRLSASRNISRGLRPVENLPRGTLVAYSASSGQQAADGTRGAHSPFAQAFARRLAEPGLEVRFLFAHVRDDVLSAVRAGQEPWIGSSLSAEQIIFVPRAEQPVAVTAQPPAIDPSTLDALAWQGAVQANSVAALSEYIRLYPNGRFVALARQNLERLSKPEASIAATERRPPVNSFAAFDPSQLRPDLRDIAVAARDSEHRALASQISARNARVLGEAANFGEQPSSAPGTRVIGENRHSGAGYGAAVFQAPRIRGDKYSGLWRSGRPNGYGVYTFATNANNTNGSMTYEGEFQQGNKIGYGVFLWLNGNKFAGQFLQDAATGLGVYTFPDGSRVEGEFRNWAVMGLAVRWSAQGAVLAAGRWDNGQLVE